MGTRGHYRRCIYTTTDNGDTGVIVRKENKGEQQNNRVDQTGQWQNQLGIKQKQWGDNNRSAIVYVAQWENLEEWYNIGKEQR